MRTHNKQAEKNNKCTLRELPYFSYRGDLASLHGRFNNSLSSTKPTKRNLEKLTSLYDLDLFSLNNDNVSNPEELFPYIRSKYYSPHSFEELKNSLQNKEIEQSFSIFHNNIRSINCNLENLQSQLFDELDFHFDVIGITETKINVPCAEKCDSVPKEKIPKITGYNFEHVPTPLAFGGVGLFIDESLDYVILEKTCTAAFQALWIEICHAEKKNIVCGIIYRQHNSPDQFLRYFETTIESMISSGKKVCVLGDANLDLLKSERCQYSNDFLTTLLSCYLIPTIDKPTRVHKNSASLIDNIFVCNPEDVSISGNIISDISDHFSQFCIIRSAKDKKNITKKKVRDFSNFSADKFKSDISQIKWNIKTAGGMNDANRLFSSFYKKLNKVVNKHAPIKNLSKRKAKQLSKPWITKGIRTSIKIKNKLFASDNNLQYRLYRNKLTYLIRASKKNYFHNFFNSNINNMKKTWEGINSILNRKTKPAKRVSALKDPKNNNKETRNPTRISNILNEHFASVGSKLANRLPSTQLTFNNFLTKSKTPQSSFIFSPVTAEEIQLEILSIPNNKAHGLYSCPTQLLKLVHETISEPLAALINISVSEGVYPNKLKLSKIVPVFKSDSVNDANNYRPISLLSNFNRIFEKLMYSRMISFIEKHHLLYNAQYGFRKSHSTQHAILDIINEIQSNMDKRLFSCGIFIDLKKAFDTVDHTILLKKLSFYGFRGIINEWFQSYLKDRMLTTEIESFISQTAITNCGVPQGSVLGPLLFLIYMNDLQFSSDKFNFYLFADDTNILYANKDLKSLETIVNCELEKVYNWLTVNRLTLNIKKSNYVIFRPHQKKLTYQPKINIYDNEKQTLTQLECKDYVKYLGILIDHSLAWKNHIEQITLKISRSVGMIAKLRHFVPRSILLHIYRSLILPYISYGLTVWGLASKYLLNKILILQKRALRFIYFAKKNQHAAPLFIEADILPVNYLFYKTVCCTMHDIRNGKSPNNILNLFTNTSSIHSYNTRSSASNKFYVKHSRLEIQRKAFSRVGVMVWNDIPASIRDLPKKQFKKKIHLLLLNILEKQHDYLDYPQISIAIKRQN